MDATVDSSSSSSPESGQLPQLTPTDKIGSVANKDNYGTTTTTALSNTAHSDAPAINPFDDDVQSARLSSSGTSIKNPFDPIDKRRPVEIRMELDSAFQNNESDQQIFGQEMPIMAFDLAEKQSEQYDDDDDDDDGCNKQSEEENRITATTVESMWGENYGNPNMNMNESNSSSSSNDGDENDPTTTTTTNPCSRLGLCTYWLRRLIVRVCRPHIQSPCCFSSPHLPQCLKKISPRKRQIICRSLIIIFMIITITFTLLDLIFLKRYLHSWLQSFLEFMEENPSWGGVLFVVIFVTASLCFFPVPLLSLGAGYVYIELYGLGVGICVSFIVCYIGYLCGAAICFARSRYLMRRLIVKFSEKYPVVRAVDRAFETMGFRIFVLLRLSPAMPFNALNYIGGITAIKFKSYWLATTVGVIPGLLYTIFVGATFGTVGSKGVDGNQQLDEKSTANKGVVLGLGIVLGVMGLIGTGIYARRELTKIIIAEQQAREREEQAGLRFSGSALEEDVENPQSGDDNDDVSLETIEESASVASVAEGLSESNDPSLPLDEDLLSLTMTTPARRRNWTADDIAAELPIVPVVSPFIRRMIGGTPRDDQGGDLRRTGSTGSSPINRTSVLEEIAESSALSIRNEQGQNGFLQSDYDAPVSNRRRCGTDPEMSSRKRVEIQSNISVGEGEKKGDVETTPKKGLMKLFHGMPVPSSNDFPRFNRRRCNSDPIEAEKRAAATDVANRDLLHSFHVVDRIAPDDVHRIRRRAAFMNRLRLDAGNEDLDEEEMDREWFWLFA